MIMKPIRFLLMAILTTGLEASAANPFFSPYRTPHETFPFDKIRLEHFMPAFRKGFSEQKAEIKRITDSKQAPSFENTIEPYEASGALLHDVAAVFYTLNQNESSDEIMAMASTVAEMYARHSSEISMDARLFARIKAVHDAGDTLRLRTDQKKLLKDIYDDFVLSGAGLTGASRERFQALTIRLSTLSEQFQQNTLRSTNAWEKIITDPSLLKGLPESQLSAAKARAKEKGKEGYLFDLSAPSYQSVLKYAENRDFRREIYVAYNTRATSGDFDNKPVIREMVNARREMAALLGYPSFAAYALQKRMAANTKGVYGLLDRLADAYLPVAKAEVAAVQGYAIGREGKNIDLQPWDWSYYSEKLKAARFQIDDEVLRPYFKLENVQKGVFGLATQLYGITFVKNASIPVWNSEVTAYDVFDANGRFLAVLYTDFFPRKTKQQGAWMSDLNEQYRKKGTDFRPQVSITMNFSKPAGDQPALLTYDEVTTLLHEFGHALHGIFSEVTYRSQSGTNVYRDFVELPSQVMENWASEKEFLDQFATHYQTGAKIPSELIQRIKDAENFNVGYACVRQLSFGYLDMAWNGLTEDFNGDASAFEKKAWAKVVVLPMPDECVMSPTFTHIFSGGYAAGYYSYKWAEVLDADAYYYFTRNKVFDPATAASFRENILSKGGTELPMTLYKRFRGQEPGIESLLRRNGIH
jgi:peptidyl-dipeptidase Dcp